MTSIKAVEFACGSCGAKNRLPFKKVINLQTSPNCGKCEQPLLRAFDKPLKDMDAASYIHPHDNETLDALKKIPGINTVLRSMIRHSFELATRLHHEANFIRVGPKQMPKIWDAFCHAQEQLGLKNRPELYVYQNPIPNAYTFGVEKNFVAISTGCLDLLTDEEMLSVLAHELGHVQADHVLYKSASKIFGSLASSLAQATLGLGSIVVYPIQIALMRWDRASELSGDRASLLVVKNPSVVLSALMKLAGGNHRFGNQLSIEEFIAQADNFEKMQDEGPLGRYFSLFDSLFRTHPYPIWRAKEILEWVSSGNFLEILDGDYQKDGEKQVAQKPTDHIRKTMKDVQDWYDKHFGG